MKSIHKIIAQDDITILANTEILLPGSIVEKRNFRYGIMKYSKNCNSPKGVLMSSALTDLSRAVIPVRAANVTDKARVIKKGAVVAACNPVTSVERNSSITESASSGNIMSELLQNAQLNDEERNAAGRVIQDLQDTFSRSSSDVDRTSLTQHRIDTVDHPPIKQQPRRLPIVKQEEVRTLLKDMQESDVIEPSANPWESPNVLVRKKTVEPDFALAIVGYLSRVGKVVLCHHLSKIAIPRFILNPEADSIEIHSFLGASQRVYGTGVYVKLRKQEETSIPLTEEAKLKTAFVTPDNTGQFERMIFGLANAPAEFQRLMNQVLGPLLSKEVLCYLDDILIPAKSWKEMMEKLRKVFDRLREAKLKLKLTKCEFGKDEVEYLGFLIKSIGMQTPGPRTVRAVLNFPKPTNEHKDKQFLGLTSFLEARHPSGNGMVKRANRTILATIKTNKKNPNHKDWDKKIKECERNLNNMINKTTNKTPFEMLHGYSPKFNDGLMRIITDGDANEWEYSVILQNEARTRIEDMQRKIKA
ncbi:Retrovirus-related Pol polyprotein from transposon 17.6, partial [Stegodyphus mimosarum]